MKKAFSLLCILGVLGFGFLLLKEPTTGLEGAATGIALCGRVIIPSLFPFTFCVLFIIKSGLLKRLSFINGLTQRLFGIAAPFFALFLLSLIGGYPLGSKMLNDYDADQKTASVMLCYCVNAGPSFIISAVGNVVFASRQIGLILFFAHIIPPFIMAFLLRKKLGTNVPSSTNPSIPAADNLVLSASESAQSLIGICSYVILFSIITSYLNRIAPLGYISMLLEVTNGIYKTRNIYIASALLGFSGISIWCQVFSLCKRIKPKIFLFVAARIFHALLSVILTFFMLRLFKPDVPTFSNGAFVSSKLFTDTAALGISLVIMGIVFIVSLCNKNYAGNMLEDIV